MERGSEVASGSPLFSLFPTLDGGLGGSAQPVPVGADRQGVAGAGKVQDVQVLVLERVQRL